MRLRDRARARQGRRVAVVDDDHTLLTSTTRLLELDGHEVATASTPADAIELVRSFRPELLLLDYYLEGGTGETVVREIRKFDSLCQVLLVTGYAADQPARKLLSDLDIQGFHDKSDGPQRLLVLVDAALKHASALRRMEEQRRQLKEIVDIAPRLSRIQPVEELFAVALEGLSRVLRGGDGVVATTNRGLFVLGAPTESISLHGATGRFRGTSRITDLPPAIGAPVRSAMLQTTPVEVEGHVIVPLHTSQGDTGCMIMEGGHLSPEAVEPCAIYARQVTQALENVLLYERATVDALTRLSTRAHGFQQLTEKLALCARTSMPVSVLMIDVDHFKRINDAFGHAAGDLALRHIADAIRRESRPSDLAARYGGEELMLVLPATGAEEALAIAERVRARIAATKFMFEGNVLSATASLGVATTPHAATIPADDLVKLADRALYRAKLEGRNRVVAHEELPHAQVA